MTSGPALILNIVNTFHCLTQSYSIHLSISHSQTQHRQCYYITAPVSHGNSLKASLALYDSSQRVYSWISFVHLLSLKTS